MQYRASIVVVLFFLSGLPLSADASDYAGNEPRSLQHSLFEVRAFRLQVRMKHAFPTLESGSILRMTRQPTVINAAKSGTGDLTTADLSISERDALRKQLRSGACPQDALIGYRLLCEGLLKLQPVRPSYTGIKYEHRGFNIR